MKDADVKSAEKKTGMKQENLELIKRAKQEWESTADSLAELICLVDYQGSVLRANRIVETWNLGKIRDVHGKNLHELLHEGCSASNCLLANFLKQAWEDLLRGIHSRGEFSDQILERDIQIQVRPLSSQPSQKEDLSESFAAASRAVSSNFIL